MRKNTLNMSWTPLEVSLVRMLTLWVTMKKPKLWLTPVGSRESLYCAKCNGFYCAYGTVLLGWSFLSAVDTQKLFSMFAFQARLCMFLKVVYTALPNWSSIQDLFSGPIMLYKIMGKQHWQSWQSLSQELWFLYFFYEVEHLSFSPELHLWGICGEKWNGCSVVVQILTAGFWQILIGIFMKFPTVSICLAHQWSFPDGLSVQEWVSLLSFEEVFCPCLHKCFWAIGTSYSWEILQM